jgi:hypothetical protein
MPRFAKGTHWRTRKPFWDRDWMLAEYSEKKRTCGEIAAEFGVSDNAVCFWLKKHGIEARSVAETRSIKHWGAEGAKNPMHGKTGILNPNWKGGLTPARQAVYSRSEWKALAMEVRKRDKACRLCGSGVQTEIHHIDPFSQSPLLVLDIGNVILLCAKCHRKLLGKEKRWKRKLFKLIQTERR